MAEPSEKDSRSNENIVFLSTPDLRHFSVRRLKFYIKALDCIGAHSSPKIEMHVTPERRQIIMAAVSRFVSGTSEKILTLSECLSRLHQMVPKKFVPELIPVSDVAGISTLKESSVNMVANVTNPSALMADVAAGNEKKRKSTNLHSSTIVVELHFTLG